MNLLITKKVDGIILAGSNFVHEKACENQYIADAAAQVPVMLLNADLDLPNVYSVVSDDYTSMYTATLEMFQSGTEDILYFYNSNSFSGKRKLAGFLAAMEKMHFSAAEVMTRFYRGSHEDIHAMVACLKQFHENGHIFHGIIAADDILAVAGVKYAREMHYRIPEDISVLGYNNSMPALCCEPELTSIDNKQETLCQHLIVTLLGVLEGKEMPKKTVFSGEIIKRGTTR